MQMIKLKTPQKSRNKRLILLALTCLVAQESRQQKRRSCWTRDWIARRATLGFSNTLINELVLEDGAEFRLMFRMDVAKFEELLSMVGPLIRKEDTLMRLSICARDKLLVTLRFLATGNDAFYSFVRFLLLSIRNFGSINGKIYSTFSEN